MSIRKENNYWLLALISFTLLYYAWIFIWQQNDFMLTTGGSLLTIFGASLSSIWLWRAIVQSASQKDRQMYWILLFSCTSFYAAAEIIWFFVHHFLYETSAFSGLHYFFYICSDVFYFLACVQRIWKRGNRSLLIKFIFNVGVLMTVSLSFTWYYLIAPLIEQETGSFFSLASILYYPVADLFLILCGFTFYFGGNQFFKKRTLYVVLAAMLIHFMTDAVYFTELIQGLQFPDHLVDPLLLLPMMLVGYIVLVDREPATMPFQTNENLEHQVSIFQLALPYLFVVLLFVFTAARSNGIDAISIGSGISIVFIILRQIFVISDNQKLVRQYQQKREELKISEERYRSLFEYHPDTIFSLDLKGRIENMNTAGAKLTGYDHEFMVGTHIASIVETQHQTAFLENFSKVKEGWIHSHEFTLKKQDGKHLWINMTHIPILVKNHLVGIFGVGKDITEQKLNEKKIRFLAYHDYLTGLANRRLFEVKLKQAIEHSGSTNTNLAVLFLDINKFKSINDLYGHEIGDELLMAAAERIKQFTNNSDTAARIGGDEFTILLQCDSADHAQLEINRLEHLLDLPYTIGTHTLSCTASIGIAHYPADGTTPNELLNKADQSMYKVKRMG
ncbi:sensor domain-containing diguanylate cyclase [Marinilactibacillus piezotolerans]|uniref:sensor domain-containing diguanylate cyclase n=1 Tax=Marinilactibacillus piezotolerans TaxID=258723 RepID=UPI0009AFF15A|nr:sensor domain-containing diguanylate cyclase [Marinilactibacillus piezotolerans]